MTKTGSTIGSMLGSMLGSKRESMLGSMLTGDELRARAEAFLASASASESPDADADAQRLAEGRELVFELGVRHVELDIAHRALVQRTRELEGERDELQELFDTAPFGSVILDVRGEILRANRGATQMLGQEFVGPFASLVTADHAITFYSHLRRVLEHGHGRCELELLRADGRPLAVQLDSGRLPGKRASESRARVVISDMTSHRVAEHRQHAAELLLSQMGEAVDDVFYVRDARSGVLLYTSLAYASVWGQAPDAFGTVPPQWPAAVHPQDRERVLIGHRFLLEGVRFDDVYRIVRPDGEVRWIHDRGAQVRDAGSRFATGIARDVTRDRELRSQLQQAQKLEALGRLASGVAHEYNNLLMSIEGCTVVGLAEADRCPGLGRDCDACPVRAHIVSIGEVAERGRSLAKDLLRLHHLDASEGVAVLDVVVAKLGGILSRLLGDAVQVTVRLGATGRMVPLSEGGIEQLLLNLTVNARDAMPDGGGLWLETSAITLDEGQAARFGQLRAGAYVQVTIRDNGRGMDPRTQERVFEPFFTTKGIGEGTGLGLSTVRAMVLGCGGDVRIDSERGAGTTFTLYLPQCDEPAAPTIAVPPAPIVAPKRTRTVLVVEDQSLVLMVVEHYLISRGYEVLTALRPSVALQKCEAHEGPIDLLLTDISMPEMNGLQLAERVRASRPDVHVLYMSAYPRRVLLAEGRIEEHMDTLEKPFGDRELLAAVRRVLDESSRTQ